MIARKITYHGNFNNDAVAAMFDIARKVEITGQVKAVNDHEVVLNLEGDASMIKLIQHQIERKVKVSEKKVEPIPYQNYVGITFLK